ncbi:MAG: YbaB/EbfC family nucleoid-associated protein [Candidatus Krumholzibacteria bacterium]|jgi:DNA-binding YbaB/EbfC family protein|nr:YbaB/EbfC family nucleoid-associated protein [Candidatus Krumholzibacteria bacterium]
MKDLGKLLKQAQQVQAKVAEMQAELALKTVEASAGGGMVTVVMNGKNEVVSMKIDPEVVDPGDVEMLEDLVIAALNEARSKVEEMIQNEMSAITGGLPMPGLF